MTWFLRSRLQLPTGVTAGLLLLACALMGTVGLPIPNIGSWLTATVTLAMLAPALLAAVLGSMVAVGYERETFATRRVGLMDRGLVLALSAIAVGLLALAGMVTSSPGAAIAARNTLGFFGLALMARRVAVPLVVAATPVTAALVLLVGSSLSPSMLVQWTFDSAGSLRAAVVAAAFWVTGAVVGSGRNALCHLARA